MEHIKALLTKKEGRGSKSELAITGAVLQGSYEEALTYI